MLVRMVASLRMVRRSYPRYHSTAQALMGHAQPEQNASEDISGVKVLMFSNSENGLTKLVKLSLQNHGVDVKFHEFVSGEDMIEKSKEVDHDMIICPFLTKRIPQEIWECKKRPCLIVHPGIVGDRGASSIDWAIWEKQKSWGVTILQAAEEMDTGDIWSTHEFPVTESTTKGELYNGEVSQAAAEAVLEAVKKYKMEIPPTPLNYSNPEVKGILKPNIKRKERTVDFGMPSENIVSKIKMSDSQPGCRATLKNIHGDVLLVGGHLQPMSQTAEIKSILEGASPGELVGQKNGAVLIKAADGNGVWVTHMKRHPGKNFLKLPSTTALAPETLDLPTLNGPTSWEEISVNYLYGDPRIAIVNFDFYNGAMSTDQCKRLQSEIEKVSEDSRVRAVVLLGGKTFFSNGIHLNMIEAADDPVEESWLNINAINDVIYSFVSMKDKFTIAALQSGAGAGGAMMAAAADCVWAKQNVLLTPTYMAMNLYGSEYWTYFLPRRVGQVVADTLTNSTQSILSQSAEHIGLVDKTFGRSADEFLQQIPDHIFSILNNPLLEAVLEQKAEKAAETSDVLEQHRAAELAKMRTCFESEEYHQARKDFVYH